MKNLNAIKATVLCIAVSALANTVTAQGTNDQVATQLYFGDTHLHTSYSVDAGMVGDRLGPDEAYRFARGEEVVSSTGQPVRLSRPLDWLVVADHSDGMGMIDDLKAVKLVDSNFCNAFFVVFTSSGLYVNY